MAVTSTLTIYRGQAITWTATATTPTNITGWNFAFTVRLKFGVNPITLTATNGAGITITDANNGVITISLTNAQTLQVPSSQNGGYVWDLQRTDAGFEDTLGSGPFVIQESYRQ